MKLEAHIPTNQRSNEGKRLAPSASLFPSSVQPFLRVTASLGSLTDSLYCNRDCAYANGWRPIQWEKQVWVSLQQRAGKNGKTTALNFVQIPKKTSIGQCERKQLNKLYMNQSVTVRLDQGKTRRMKTGKVFGKNAVLSPIQLKLYNK